MVGIRYEATMLNARIRKVFAQKRIPIFSIGNPGDLTYDYSIIGDTSDDLKKCLTKNQNFQKTNFFKKPIIIVGVPL